jgi:hypothetical protein
MHWIEERLKEHNQRRERKRKIEDEAPRTYGALWNKVVEDIKIANQTAYIGVMQIMTEGNASLYDLSVLKPSTNRPRTANILLSEDRHSIVISGDVRMKFFVRVCQDGTVCLQDDSSTEIGVEEAARRILDPLLFPDLQKPEFAN